MAEGDPVRIIPHRGVDDDCGSPLSQIWRSTSLDWKIFSTRVCSRVGVTTAATAAITSRAARAACSASSSCASG
jgi:hypothetical protein